MNIILIYIEELNLQKPFTRFIQKDNIWVNNRVLVYKIVLKIYYKLSFKYFAVENVTGRSKVESYLGVELKGEGFCNLYILL